MKNRKDFDSVTTIGNVLFASYAVSSYNEGSVDQLDFYLSEGRTSAGEVAYVFKHDMQTYTKLKILACLKRSADPDWYDALPDDVLVQGEDISGADTSAEFITDDDCYLVWFCYDTVCSSGWDLILSVLSPDETILLPGQDGIAHYFSGPKELLSLFCLETYPDACGSEVMLEVPSIGFENMEQVTVSISPTREIDGGTEDYDWNTISIPEQVCSSLLRPFSCEPSLMCQRNHDILAECVS